MGMVKFENNWKYQSYRPDPGSVAADPDSPPIFVPWSPPGVVTINEDGATGTLVLAGVPIPLNLTFQITDGNPAMLSISAVANLRNGKQFTNELQGWFVPATLDAAVDATNPYVVRGSIVQTSEDIAKPPQPIFTTGFFILEPLP